MTIPLGLLPPRKPDTHKGDCGRVLVVAGSRGMSGAAALCAAGALRAGAGLVTVAAPEGLHDPLAAKLSEAMQVPLPEDADGAIAAKASAVLLRAAADKDAIAVGPGLSRRPGIAPLVLRLLGAVRQPIVLDADALNSLAKDAGPLRKAKGPVVITPHPGELARLTGQTVEQIQSDRAGAAIAFAGRYRVVTVLKGSETIVADPASGMYVNASGNPGMATGGMGDVLTGVIAALLGQKLSPFDAARLGVYLHGLAGDLAAEDVGPIGLIATDVAARIPLAIRRYQQPPSNRC